MKKILYINTVSGYVATGRITCDLARNNKYETLVCFGRKHDFGNVNSFRNANFLDNSIGALGTILFDNNLSICSAATKRLIEKIKEFNPDLIHIHNLHGYYLNVEQLFNFLKDFNKPVVWTLHDTWSFTGYCPVLGSMGCDKYKTECKNCPCGFTYPYSIFKQNVTKEFNKKKELFNSLNDLTIVTPSKWLNSILKDSILKNLDLRVVNNGINLTKFKPTLSKDGKFTIMAIANVWNKEKGSEDLKELIKLLDKDIEVIVVGNGSDQFDSVTNIKHTTNVEELVDIYSKSHAMINLTYADNFPTVNIEALACGTPVITYDTDGSPEIIDDKTGIVIPKGNYKLMAEKINQLKEDYYFKTEDCISRSKKYSKEAMIDSYSGLYEEILKRYN